MPVTHPDDVLTTSEVCRLLGITRPTLYHWIAEGRLTPWKKLGDGSTSLFLRSLLADKPPRKYSRYRSRNAEGLPCPAEQPLPLPTKPRGRSAAGEASRETGGRGAAENRASRTTARVFLVSQDKALVEQTSSELQSQGYYVSIAGDFPRVKTVLLARENPEIVVLDLDFNSEFLSGWKLFSEIKKLIKGAGQHPPVYLLLSGKRTAPQDAAKAFKNGAWDFLKRPLASSVFMARVRLALRRRFWSELDANPHGYALTSRDECLALDPHRRLLKIRCSSEQDVFRHLTRKESELLCLFLKRPGLIFSKAMLLEIVWGYSVNIRTRTVDCHIKNLRQKLSPYGSRIETHYSSGYRVVDPLPAEA